MQAIEHAIQTSGQANKRALARKLLIEKRKEEQERLLLEQEREQEEQRMIQLRISEEAEEKRRKADMYAQMLCSVDCLSCVCRKQFARLACRLSGVPKQKLASPNLLADCLYSVSCTAHLQTPASLFFRFAGSCWDNHQEL